MNYHIFFTVTMLMSTVYIIGFSTSEKPVADQAPLKTDRTEKVVPVATKRTKSSHKSNHFEITSEAEFNDVIASGDPIVVDFFATWCGPCKNFAPTFEKVAAEFSEVMFVTVDVDTLKSVAGKQGVQSMPTIVFYNDGKEVSRFTGQRSPAELRKLVKGLIA